MNSTLWYTTKLRKHLNLATCFIITLCSLNMLGACQPLNNADNNAKQPLISSDAIINVNELKQLTTQSQLDASAHWLSQNLLLWPKQHKAITELQIINAINNGSNNTASLEAINITAREFPLALKQQWPHLANFNAYHVDISAEQAKKWLKNGLYVAAKFADHSKKISQVQIANVLDDLYTTGNHDADEVNDLGASIKNTASQNEQVTFKLWAPTASQVKVLVFNEDHKKPLTTLTMLEDSQTGVWSAKLTPDADKASYHLAYYQYQITVYHPETQKHHTLTTTDPYSLSLSTNSQHSQIIDLNANQTMPLKWHSQTEIILQQPEDAVIYETHIRDFSAAEQQLSNEQYRGKYKAFSEKNSAGIKHIQSLQQAGLNHIHLLPTFDLGTINEDKHTQISLSDTLGKVCQLAPETSICQQEFDKHLTLQALLNSFDPNSADAQQVIGELRMLDNYNWGYDPFHYTVPEGSYAVNPEGVHRIIEFREMIQSLHNMGFRVIMDVVYNHTHQAGLKGTSVLDKIVPTYYQRLHPITGKIEQSTCCDNTATEHVMMEKLMIDSLVVWARDYKIDGFRFDLMGHQPKTAMLKARDAVRAIDPDTYFYGEGWNFGEVANNQQFIQASQLELAGTEIGTYTDRLRDAVRGSSFNVSGFDHRKNQGIGNGLGTFNNEMQNQNDHSQYYSLMDQLRLGLAGNLANFPLENAQGQLIVGKDLIYGDQPAGYALDPADTINYVSKHDNQTLWDNSQYRLPYHATTEQRVRLHNQSLSYAILAQGIPFIHMGSELLRSKSFLRDSYDYSDWFNLVDYSKSHNNYHVGLPPKEKDEANWPLIQTLIKNNQGRDRVTSSDIEFASASLEAFLKIRSSSSLFRLTSAQAIINKVSFLNTGTEQKKGLIVMLLDDTETPIVDNNYQQIVVVFNNNPTSQTFAYQGLSGFVLHPVQQQGADKTAAKSKIISTNNKTYAQVPAFTTAVFVNKRN